VLFTFDDHVLDTERRELRRGALLVAVEPQVFDLLVYLVRNRSRVVSKDELIQGVWGGRIVSDSAVTTRLNAARKAVADSGSAQLLIRTVHGVGVRFIGEVSEEVVAPPSGSGPLLTPRLSIVVLPFVNFSGDPTQQYFADGITEDLTTDLSRIPGMLVISRHTAFTYRDKPIDTRQIGRELAVRYVLEGSVRRLENRVRVTAQLIDAETAAHLWAERFAGDTADLFALQDEITSWIAVTVGLELVAAEAARPVEQANALDCILRGRAARLGPPTIESHSEAIRWFECALTLDPRSIAAQSWLAQALASRVLDAMSVAASADVARADILADNALAAAPRSALAHFARANVLRAQNRFEEAIPEFETVIALNRNWANAHSNLGWCKFLAGEIDALIPAQEKAIRLSPRDPVRGAFYGRIGRAHLLQSRTDEAIVWFEKARNASPRHSMYRAFLASAYARKDDTGRAATELAEARRLAADDRYSSIARSRPLVYSGWGAPKIRALVEATYFTGLRKAGVPEE
jgi:TolB-like protein/tetratricopeptide (TPR) repeat protein